MQTIGIFRVNFFHEHLSIFPWWQTFTFVERRIYGNLTEETTRTTEEEHDKLPIPIFPISLFSYISTGK